MSPKIPHNPENYNAPLRIALIRLSLKQCLIEKLKLYNKIGVENLDGYDLEFYQALKRLPERIGITLAVATSCLLGDQSLAALKRAAGEYIDTADMVIEPHVEEEAARMHAENLAVYQAAQESAEIKRAGIVRDAQNPNRN